MYRQLPSRTESFVLWLLLSVCIIVVGCGESTKDAMIRIAKQRAAAKEKAAAEEKKNADATAANPPPATNEATPDPTAPKPDQPAPPATAIATAAPPAIQSQNAAPPTSTVAVAPPAVAPTLPPPTASPASVTVEPPSRNLLYFDSTGRTVASLGDGNNISVHDVATKALLRNAFNENLTPTCIAMDSKRGTIAVGGSDGSFKAFALASTQGLDRFAQDRMIRRDRDRPLKAHTQSITAIATSGSDKVLATGDVSGEVRLWSAQQSEPVEYTGGKAGLVRIKTFQKDQLLFALTKSNKVLFWKDGAIRDQPEEFASLVNRPTVIQSGPGGKGMAVGDDRGRVTFWLPESGNLKKQNFQPHGSAVSGLAFNSAGDALITAARSGEILRWQLPLDSSDIIELSEPPRFVSVSNDGRLISVPSRKSYLDVFSAREQSLSRSFHLPSDRRVTSSAFSNDGRTSAVGDDGGNIYFFGSGDDPHATLVVGDSSIDHLSSSKQRESLALSTKSGQIGVLRFPSLDPTFAQTGLCDLAATDVASRKIMAVSKSAIQILDADNGAIVHSLKYSGDPITAGYVDSVLALLATNQGELLMWRFLSEDAKLDSIRPMIEGASKSVIVGIGLTKFGQVWTCDSEGKCALANIENATLESNPSKHTLSRAARKIDIGPNEKSVLLDDHNGLFLVDALSPSDPIGLATDATFADVASGEHTVVALTNDKHHLVRIDVNGNEIERISVDDQQGEISQFACSDRSAILLMNKGQTLAVGGHTNPFGRSQTVATGHLQEAWLSSDASTYLVKTPEGAIYRGSSTSKSVRIPIAEDGNLLAISASGRSAIVASKAKIQCIEFEGERIKATLDIPSQGQSISAADFSHDDRAVYFAAEDGDILRVMRADTTKTTSIGKVDGKPVCLLVNATQDRMVVHLDGGRVLLMQLDADGSKVICDSGQQAFRCVALAGSHCLLGAEDGTLHEMADGIATPRKLFQVASHSVDYITYNDQADRCMVVTGDQSTHWVRLKDGLWLSRPPNKDSGKCLALQASSKGVVLISSNGRMQAIRGTMIRSLAGPETHIQKVAATQDGKWVMAIDPRGKLARWSITADGFSKPLRCSIDISITDIKAFSTGSRVCLVGPKGLIDYNASTDSAVSKISIDVPTASISHVGRDWSAVIRVGESFRVADFESGAVRGVEVAKDHVGFTEANVQGKPRWHSVGSDGVVIEVGLSSKEASKSDSFSVGQKPLAVNMQGELLLTYTTDFAKVTRSDGSSLNVFKQESGKLVTAGVARSSGLLATVDDVRRITISNQGKTLRSVQMPLKSNVSSLIWNANGDGIAVASDQQVLLMDAATLKVYATCKSTTPIRTILNWTGDSLWCIAKDQRMLRIKVPMLQWTEQLASPSSVLAWHVDDKELVCANESGVISAFAATSGELLNKTESGKTGLRSICNLSSSNRLAMLGSTSSILTFDADHRIGSLPVSSALQLTSIASDATGRYLYASNNAGEVFSWDISKPDAAPKTVPCELRCNMVKVVENGRLAAAGTGQPSLALLSSTSSQDVIGRISGIIEDFALLPDDSYAAIVDGTSAVQLFGIANRDTKRLVGTSVGFQTLAIHPRGVRIVAGGNAVGRPSGKLVIWDTDGLKAIGEVELPSKPHRLVYSNDGGLIAAALEDGECQLFDGLSGTFLESISPTKGLNSIEFSEDGRRLLFALEDGSIQSRPLRSIGVLRASTSPISQLAFSPSGKQLIVADAVGKLSIRETSNLSLPSKELEGAGAKVLQTKFSTDGLSMAAVFDSAEHAVLVWKLDSATGLPASTAPDVVIRSPEARNLCVAFTLDGQYLLLGGEDGLIRAWSHQDNREVARFRGHTSSVLDIAPYLEAGRFVSGDIDRSIRTWRFPGNLPRPGDPIPEGSLVEGTQIQRVSVPQQTVKEEDDRIAAARQALIKGNPNDQQVGEIFKLLSNDTSAVAEMTASSRKLRALENDPNASIEEIYRERQRNSQLRNKLDIGGRGRSQVNFAGGFLNAVMQVDTNFRFTQEEATRPVRICFADRFLFASRPSVPKKPVDPDNPQPTGDNGDLLSWEYRVTQLAAREWSIEEVNVQELFPIPESNAVFAAPSMMLFSQNDGISRQFPSASQWGLSKNQPGKRQYFVVGSIGGARLESEILRIYDAAQLTSEKLTPISHYSSYEAGVTALAFSNQSSLVAFAVRERAVHRVFVADMNRFDKSLVMVAEYSHKRPWFATDAIEPGVPGITSLAFSLDNRYLVGHGQYDEQLWKFTTWSINAGGDGTISGNREWELENKEKPFLNELNSRPIRFVKTVASSSRERGSSANLMVIENDSGYATLDLNARKVVGSIPYLGMQRGLPQRSLSEDGRWLIMGDDRGNVYVWNVITGQRHSVAYTNDVVPDQAATKPNGKASPPKVIQERPAHSGPVTGVALSSIGRQGDFPEFAASIGEENRLIVWDLIPVLGKQAPTGTVKRQAKK